MARCNLKPTIVVKLFNTINHSHFKNITFILICSIFSDALLIVSEILNLMNNEKTPSPFFIFSISIDLRAFCGLKRGESIYWSVVFTFHFPKSVDKFRKKQRASPSTVSSR